MSRLFGFIILTLTFYGCQSKSSSEDWKFSESNIDTIEFFGSKVKVYVLARTWGLLGNHEELSIFSDKSSDSIKLNTSEAYYRKAGSDSLIVYAPSSSIFNDSKKNIGEIKIWLNELTSQAEVMDYDANYRKYGLKKISPFTK